MFAIFFLSHFCILKYNTLIFIVVSPCIFLQLKNVLLTNQMHFVYIYIHTIGVYRNCLYILNDVYCLLLHVSVASWATIFREIMLLQTVFGLIGVTWVCKTKNFFVCVKFKLCSRLCAVFYRFYILLMLVLWHHMFAWVLDINFRVKYREKENMDLPAGCDLLCVVSCE
jgi:hypothetical protein